MLTMTLVVNAGEVKGWPEQVKSVNYQASIDKSQQPMLVHGAKSSEKRPLLVGFHSWSGDYTQAGGEVVYARWCMESVKQALPAGLEKADADPLYGNKHVIFRKVLMNTRVTIFQGGHDIIYHAALNWLAQQRKGKPANWNVTAEHKLKTDENENVSGR